ncbi:membrane hypothetical protein [Mesorhizobium sp. ORS 3324]|nr:membrane hypothetical protein [Mesorhizobium sp. ORS 3324]
MPAMDDNKPARRRTRDLTSGPIPRTLLLFALPVLGSNILQSLNGSINAVWVGRFLGEAALTATSNANLVLFLILGTVFGIGMAATILVAQSVGARDLPEARRIVGTSATFFFLVSVVFAVCGWIWVDAILTGLGTPADALPLARLSAHHLRRRADDEPFVLRHDGAARRRRFAHALCLHGAGGRARRRLEPASNPRHRPFPRARHCRLGHLDADRPDGERDRHPDRALCAQESAAAGRQRLCPTQARSGAAAHRRLQGHSHGPADDRHLGRGADRDGDRQLLRLAGRRRLRHRGAALDLCSDAGFGHRRRRLVDGGAECRRRTLGPHRQGRRFGGWIQSRAHRRAGGAAFPLRQACARPLLEWRQHGDRHRRPYQQGGVLVLHPVRHHHRAVCHGPGHRRRHAAAGHPDHLGAHRAHRFCLFHAKHYRSGGAVVELPGWLDHFAGAGRRLLPFRPLAEHAYD